MTDVLVYAAKAVVVAFTVLMEAILICTTFWNIREDRREKRERQS